MDTLTSIKVFRQVVESGSFVAASERLDLSTAMVSKHVMHVEQRLGIRLLNRNSRTLSLTEPGRVYFERSKTILDDLEQTDARASLGLDASDADAVGRVAEAAGTGGDVAVLNYLLRRTARQARLWQTLLERPRRS